MKKLNTRESLRFRLFKRINYYQAGAAILATPLIATLIVYAPMLFIGLYSAGVALLVVYLVTMYAYKHYKSKRDVLRNVETALQAISPGSAQFTQNDLENFIKAKDFRRSVIEMIQHDLKREKMNSIYLELVADYQIRKGCVIVVKEDPSNEDISTLFSSFYAVEKILIFYALLGRGGETKQIGLKAIEEHFNKTNSITAKSANAAKSAVDA
jgi:hypothetical protein